MLQLYRIFVVIAHSANWGIAPIVDMAQKKNLKKKNLEPFMCSCFMLDLLVMQLDTDWPDRFLSRTTWTVNK